MPCTGSILIVDCESTIGDFLVEFLTDAGYIALSVSESASALQIIVDSAPALLLLDIGMPGLSSSELITALERAGLARLPIVLMTTEPDQIKPLLVEGKRGCLAKPFDLDDVLACVEQYARPLDAALVSRAPGAPAAASR
jgi:DNA-binding response OmpR family regulator